MLGRTVREDAQIEKHERCGEAWSQSHFPVSFVHLSFGFTVQGKLLPEKLLNSYQ
jgi:hypothetical protein